jgi:hypothetical protein
MDIKKEVRKTHFILGNNQPTYVSHSGGTLVEFPITKEQVLQTEKSKQDQIDRNRKANFTLPQHKNTPMEQSSYKQYISDVAAKDNFFSGKATILSGLKDSSIQIGQGNQGMGITEAKEQFTNPN